MHHLRDSIRHALAAVLMLGTLAGTVWTFSAGSLRLSGAWEGVVSVGGIATALECGVILTGDYLGELDRRIKSARRRDILAEMVRLRAEITRWFYLVAAISAVANFLFRVQLLHNWALAAFVAVAPIVLVVLFLIKLRPLPTDYTDVGARATGRALVHMVEQSERTIMRSLARMGKGRELGEAEMRQLALAVRITSTYARQDESQALDHALAIAAPTVETTVEEWLRTADIARIYGCSVRTAQGWMARVPGRRHIPNSNGWEAPASAVYAACGAPRDARDARQESVSRPHGSATHSQAGVRESQGDETVTLA